VDNARVFGSITKFEKQADGTLYVEGIASSESVDSQGEIVKASAIKAAATDYLKFPAVREMHQLIAAGKALGLDVGEDGKTYIAAKIVDPIAIRKIEEGVYKGFSIGGSVPPGGRNKDDPKIIEQLKLSEISLVDRPANPDCVVTLFKAEAEPPGSAKAAPAAKGMYQVAWAAQLCQDLASLASEARWEADFEGDDSKVPGRLKSLCVELCDILKELVAEEADELVATEKIAADAALEFVNKPGALKKSERVAILARALLAAGKGKSIDAVEAVATKAGDALKPLIAERDELKKRVADLALELKAKGVPKDPKFIETAVKLEEMQKAYDAAEKATAEAGAALRKMMTERDELVKQREQLQQDAATATAKFTEAIDKVTEERDELATQRDNLIKRVAVAEVKLATKGVLKVVPVAKEQDVDAPVAEEGTKPPEGTPERAIYELKKVHSRGGKAFALGPAGS
jgi:hypothetical protein